LNPATPGPGGEYLAGVVPDTQKASMDQWRWVDKQFLFIEINFLRDGLSVGRGREQLMDAHRQAGLGETGKYYLEHILAP
jgi:hypothetical protein